MRRKGSRKATANGRKIRPHGKRRKRKLRPTKYDMLRSIIRQTWGNLIHEKIRKEGNLACDFK